MREFNFKNILPQLSVIALSLIGSYIMFGRYMLHPNSLMTGFGGDAYVIYYDVMYHVCQAKDTGSQLMNMNYPYGEYIYMTDAEGALATLLKWLNNHGMPVCDCVIGVMHSLMIYLLPVASLLMYYVLRAFHIRQVNSVIFAVLIIFLSPIMIRFAGHYGLSYPFVFPMVMLWIIRKYDHHRFEWRDLIFALVCLFFTFNNPYIGFSALGLTLVSALVVTLKSMGKWTEIKRALFIGLVPVLVLAIVFITFKITDDIPDRLKQQWGFFFLNASIAGSFYPPQSLLHSLLSSLGVSLADVQFEAQQNIGIITTLLLLSGLFTFLWSKYKLSQNPSLPPSLITMVFSSILIYIYAASDNLIGFNIDWVEEHLGSFLMFKASGRLAWPFYFVVSVVGVYIYNNLTAKFNYKTTYACLAILAFVWMYEIKVSIVEPYLSNMHHDNMLSKKDRAEVLNDLKNANIDINEYQALLCVPKMQAWTDKFIGEIVWSTQFHSTRISLFTGLPMVNAMLSRQGTNQTALATQMLSDPLISRELLPKLPTRKDLLIVLGADHPPLKDGEQFLIDASTLVMEKDDYSLHRLPLTAIEKNPQIISANEKFASGYIKKPLIRLGFEDQTSEITFYGKGSKRIEKGRYQIHAEKINIDKDTVQLNFSAWTHIDHKKYSMGEWQVIVENEKNEYLNVYPMETRRSNDIQHMWIRSKTTFPVPRNGTIKVIFEGNQTFLLDEVIIDEVETPSLIHDIKSNYFLYKGVKIRKP